jgi:hypothetical protein
LQGGFLSRAGTHTLDGAGRSGVASATSLPCGRITAGFHRSMKLIQRRAYGFKNFNNARPRGIDQGG